MTGMITAGQQRSEQEQYRAHWRLGYLQAMEGSVVGERVHAAD